MKTPILGQSYVARSPNAAANRCVNLFPEALVEGRDAAWLQRAPGLRLLTTMGTGPVRGLWVFGGMLYAVSGANLYSVSPTLVVTLIGAVGGTGRVSMADNGTQLFVATNPRSYIFNKDTSVFVEINDPDFPGAGTVAFLDGYFVFNEPDSQKLWVTSLLDGTAVDPLEFASAEGAPDNIVGVISDHREVWVFGTTTTEVWINSGDVDFPLQRIAGAFNEIGCASAASIAKLDNGLFWLGIDARGKGIVYRSNGYTGARVSTHAVEWQIQSYATISDAISYSYQQDGHSFYVLTFPSANKTWVYDVATRMWHERASGNLAELRHRSNCGTAFNGQIVVGDYETGALYALDPNVYSDGANVQRWVRSWRALPPGADRLKGTLNHQLWLGCQGGVGTDLIDQGRNPQVMLRWSDDGGHKWSNEHWTSMGGIGETDTRVIWRRLGSAGKLHDRVYEVSGTDPVKIAITDATLRLTGTD
jgi:hypothetical protein